MDLILRTQASLPDVADVLFGQARLPGWIQAYQDTDEQFYGLLWQAYERGREQIGQLHDGRPVWMKITLGTSVAETGRGYIHSVFEYEQMMLSRGTAMERTAKIEARTQEGYVRADVTGDDILLLRAQLEGVRASHLESDDYRPLGPIDEVLRSGEFDARRRRARESERMRYLLERY